MKIARLMNTPEDYARLGINPDQVELWEDGKREVSTPNHFEWWYFDGILDDGTKVVVQFLSKPGPYFKLNGDHPSVKFTVTLPDGTKFHREPFFKAKETSMSKEKCDLRYGKHTVTGNLKDYTIHFEEMDGLGCDLKLHSLSSPYRPGSAYFGFNDDDHYYTWLCVVPRGELTGTLTINGKRQTVHGRGYHDHQWGSVNFHEVFNNWVWARQNYEDYSLLVFDMVAREEYGRKRFPIVFLQDNEGNLLFDSTEGVSCQVLDQFNDAEGSGKDYPSEIQYRFEKNGKVLDYHLKMTESIENMGVRNMGFGRQLMVKLMKLTLSYIRFTGVGTMDFNDGTQTTHRENSLIYEFMYPGLDYKGYM